MGPADQYMPEHRGLLALTPNAGLTFDLRAIRKAHPGIVGPLRVQAHAGLAHPEGLADILVFVDGQLKLQRMGLRQKDGVIRVDVQLAPSDKFLTLASTDGGGRGTLRLGRLRGPGSMSGVETGWSNTRKTVYECVAVKPSSAGRN